MNVDNKEAQEGTPQVKSSQTAEDILRLSTQDKEAFKKAVLDNPLETLKPATVTEVIEGIEIVDHELQKDHRPPDRQKRNQELAQNIIAYKTGKEVDPAHQTWTRSTANTFREVLWQRGLVPRGFLPTRMERIRGNIGSAVSFYTEPLRDSPKAIRDAVKDAYKEPSGGNSKPTG